MTERHPHSRLPAALGLLALVAAAGVVRLLGSRGYQEFRLQRMGEPELRAWSARQPGDALGHFYLARARERSGGVEAAAREYALALDLDPRLTEARPPLAALLLDRGQHRAAQILLQQGVSIDPAAAPLRAGLARIAESQRDFRRAASEWQLATSLAPEDVNAWFHLGRCRMSLNDDAQALPSFQRAVRLAPLSAEHQEALAGALRLRGRFTEAESHCRRALFLRPDDPVAHFELAKLLRDRDGPTSQAEQSMRDAAALQPDDPLLHYSLAAICLERGEANTAAAEYRTTLRLLRTHAPPAASTGWPERSEWLSYQESAHFGLSHALERMGQATEAARHLNEFRRVSDTHRRVNQLLVRAAARPGDAALRAEMARWQANADFGLFAGERRPAPAGPRSAARK